MLGIVNQALIPGLAVGCIYGLAATGLALTFGSLRFNNFAYGQLIIIGAYITYLISSLTEIHILLAVPLAMIFTAGLMLLMDWLVFKPMRGGTATTLMLASFALMFILQAAVQILSSGQTITLVDEMLPAYMLMDNSLVISQGNIIIFSITLPLLVLLYYLLFHSRIGVSIRAMADNPQLVQLSGIDTEIVIRRVWIICSCLAVIAGVFLASNKPVAVDAGAPLLLPIFAATLIGGLGRPFGAAFGGVTVGILQEVANYLFAGEWPFLAPSIGSMVALVLILVLLPWQAGRVLVRTSDVRRL